MRSTKYDKKGSLYGDMIKPLELWLYNSIRYHEKKTRRRMDKKHPHLNGMFYESKELQELADLRGIVEVTAETVVRLAIQKDAHIVKQPEGPIPSYPVGGWHKRDIMYDGFSFEYSDGTHINLSPTECCTVDHEGEFKSHLSWPLVVKGEMTPEGFADYIFHANTTIDQRTDRGSSGKLLKSQPSIKELTEEAIRARIDAATAWMEKYCVPLSRDFNVEPESISLGYSVKAEDTQDDDAPIEKNELKDKPPPSPIFEDRFVPRFWAWQDELRVYMSLCIQYEIAKDVFIPVPEVVLEKAKMQKGSASEECFFAWVNISGGQWLSRRILKEWADAVEELKDYEGAIESLVEDTKGTGLDDAVLLPQRQGNLGEVISAKEWKQRLDAKPKLVYSIEEKKYLVQCSGLY